METETREDSEGNAKVSDSAYSNSCSNSQSRRSRSSKSTNSGSRSSGSSGYGGNPSTSTESSDKTEPLVKRTKDKDGKKKKFKLPQKALGEKKSSGQLPKISEDTEKLITRISTDGNSCTTHIDASIITKDLTTVDENKNEASPVKNSLSSYLGFPVNSSNELPKDFNLTDGFSCVISMADGVVMYATPSITTSLGFPKEVWIGRQFIDFVHPKDRATFSSQVTPGPEISVPSSEYSTAKKNCFSSTKCSLFCRLRRYRNVAVNVAKERCYTYTTFQLQLSYRDITEASKSGVFLVIHASPVLSAYSLPNEIPHRPTPFMTRHLAEGSVDYVDSESVSYLGYLPQDIVGKSAIDLYHPEDLTFLTQVYENIVKEGNYFSKKTYRFMIQNGDYVKLETTWSSFINPWSRKLEFVIGHHKVIEGPLNPDVFQTDTTICRLSIEANQKAKLLRDNILRILCEVPSMQDTCMTAMNKCQQDVHFDLVVDEMVKQDEELKLELQPHMEQSFSERDSVMLGGISPHHDYFDSKSSTGTPPSYNQLNYNENIQRYFDSDPPMKSEKDGDVEMLYDDDFNDTLAIIDSNDVRAPQFESADSGENSSCRSSFERKFERGQCCKLTEALLSKHNYEMEKMLIKKHREARSVSKASERERHSEKRAKRKNLARLNAEFNQTSPHSADHHGLKRCSSISWEQGDCNKGSKFAHNHCGHKRNDKTDHCCTTNLDQHRYNIWNGNYGMQGFLGAAQNMSNAHQHGSHVPTMQMSAASPYPGLYPMFYVTAPSANKQNVDQQSQLNIDGHSLGKTMAPVPYMLYPHSGMYGQPIVYAQMPCSHMQCSGATNEQGMNNMNKGFTNFDESQSRSQQTSNSSAEPASSESRQTEPKMQTDRVESRSKKNENRHKNHSSKRMKKGKYKPSQKHLKNDHNSSSTDQQSSQDLSSDPSTKDTKGTSTIDDGSTFSSFYSSFLKTDSGSGDGDSGDGSGNKNSSLEDSLSKPYSNDIKPEVQKRNMEPPWNEGVCVTSELVYKYQILTKDIDEVLKADLEVLNSLTQPQLVSEQLSQLYAELELEHLSAKLNLEDGISSSDSSNEDGMSCSPTRVKKNRKSKYNKMVMIYEEDAPFPPPSNDDELALES